jgi:threonine dehydratase
MRLSDIHDASLRLEKIIHRTALDFSPTFSGFSGADIFLKMENMQKTGSFKVRGASNAIISRNEKSPLKAVIASSAGNHAQGVAYAAGKLGIPATIVMPKGAPIAKIAATENYGAKVVLQGSVYDEAFAWAWKEAQAGNATFIHPFDDEGVIAGQGTLGLEILEQNPEIDTIVAPAGGGGLLAGIAFAAKSVTPRVRVVGVQGEKANPLVLSFKNRKRVSLDTISTIADGIAVKTPGEITTSMILQYVDDMVTVSDDEIASAIILLLERTKIVVEPAGAASLAACLYKKFALGKNNACVLSGGNIDVSFVSRIIDQGLISRGRHLDFSVVLVDKPGTLEKFAHIMSETGANVVSLFYDRMHPESRLNAIHVNVGAEVGGIEHGSRVISALKDAGYSIQQTGKQ